MVHYKLTPEQDKIKYMKFGPVKAVWASGASRETTYQLDRNRNSHFICFIPRPDVPGREADMNFALQLERNRILQQQVKAQQDAAFWQMYGAMLQQQQSFRPNTPINCTSRTIGGTTYTDCW